VANIDLAAPILDGLHHRCSNSIKLIITYDYYGAIKLNTGLW